MAPPLEITCSASTVNTSSPLCTSTPVARFPSSRIRRTVTPERTVRFSRCRTGFRYVSDVLIRTPLGLFIGMGPTPHDSGWFMSGSSGYPASRQASKKATCAGSQVSRLCRRTGIGPSDPWKSSWMSVSVSSLRK